MLREIDIYPIDHFRYYVYIAFESFSLTRNIWECKCSRKRNGNEIQAPLIASGIALFDETTWRHKFTFEWGAGGGGGRKCSLAHTALRLQALTYTRCFRGFGNGKRRIETRASLALSMSLRAGNEFRAGKYRNRFSRRRNHTPEFQSPQFVGGFRTLTPREQAHRHARDRDKRGEREKSGRGKSAYMRVRMSSTPLRTRSHASILRRARDTERPLNFMYIYIYT